MPILCGVYVYEFMFIFLHKVRVQCEEFFPLNTFQLSLSNKSVPITLIDISHVITRSHLNYIYLIPVVLYF